MDTCSQRRIVSADIAAHIRSQVLVDQHFNVYGLPDQLHSDNGREFVNNLWKELFSKFKIQHTNTPPYNPSSNPVERFHQTIIAMLHTRHPTPLLWCGLAAFVYINTPPTSLNNAGSNIERASATSHDLPRVSVFSGSCPVSIQLITSLQTLSLACSPATSIMLL